LKSQIDDLTAQLDDAKSQTASSNGNSEKEEELEKRIKKLEEQCKKHMDKHKQGAEYVAYQQGQISDLTAQLEESKQEALKQNSSLLLSLEERKDEVEKIALDFKRTSEELKQLESKYDLLLKSKKLSEDEVLKLQGKVNEQQLEIEKMHEQLFRVNEQYEEAADLKLQIQKSQDEHTKLLKKIGSLEAEIENIDKENKQRLSKLQNELKSAHDTMIDKENNVAAKEKENIYIIEEVVQSKMKLALLNQEVEEEKARSTNYRMQMKEYSEKNRELQRELGEAKAQIIELENKKMFGFGKKKT
jgi:chromosome segregation ATPase